MSFVLLGILNSQAIGGGFSYRLQTLGGASNDLGASVAVDSSGNIYALGSTASAGAGGYDLLLVQYNSSGTIQWQKVLGAGTGDEGLSVAIDSSDDVYVFGYTNSAGAGGYDFLLAKYNSSGTIQWQRVLGGGTSEQGFSVAIDSSNDVYVVGTTDSAGAGSGDLLLAKYNSSGTIQWQRVLGGASNDGGQSVAVDSSGNIYALGNTSSAGAGSIDILLAKYNSSGTIQWQRVLGDTSFDFGASVAVDSSGNIYAFATAYIAGVESFLLAKYNSSGTIQWQRSIVGAAPKSIRIDSSNNVYLLGSTASAGAGSNDFLLAKYNSSGTIQFQRTLGATGSDIGKSIAFDSSGNLYLLGQTNSTGEGNIDILLAVLPNDGSLTGTYVLDGVDMVYATSTLTAATPTLTAATSTLTASTSSLTASTSSLTSAAASLTEHRVDL